MNAIVLRQREIRFVDDFRPKPQSDEVPVRVRLAGICETDLQLAKGYMDFEGVLGHEFVGVAEVGKYSGQRVVSEINCGCRDCDYCRAGKQNHCPRRSVIGILNHDGAFADVVWVPEENLHRVPSDVTNEVAVFTEPLAAAYQIPTQVDLSIHQQAVVIGDGRMGYLIAQVLRQQGCCVLVIGKHLEKLDRFQRLGFEVKILENSRERREFDLAIDCSGSKSGIPTALRYLRPTGTLVLKTTVAGSMEIDLAPLVIDEITVVGSRCGPFAIALENLAAGEIEVQSLITDRFPLEEAADAFEKASGKSAGKVMFEVSS